MKVRIPNVILAASIALLQATAAHAEDYPIRPIKIIAPFPPGSATDIWARSIGQKLGERLGQPVIVDNRSGASGQIGTEVANKQPKDGYTILIATPPNAIHVRLYPHLSYNFQKDFAPVILLATFPLVLVTGPQIKTTSLKELLEAGKQGTEKLTFGSSGPGSSAHLAGELLASLSNAKLTHVPYAGTPTVYNDLIGGRVTMLFDNVTVAASQVRSGRVKALVVTSDKRSAILPEIPSSPEVGYPDLLASSWVAVFVRTGTPPGIVDKLNHEINEILVDKIFRERFEQQGAEIRGGTPEDLSKFFNNEVQLWGRVIDSAQIKVE